MSVVVLVRTRVQFPASPQMCRAHRAECFLRSARCALQIKGRNMSETIIIAVLLVAVVYLLMMAKTQQKKYRDVKRRVKDRVWKRDE
jgi:hypothetical protein